MKYDRLGIECLKIAALLQIARHICAALMGPGPRWEPKLFNTAYGYVGKGLTSWAIFSAVAGVLFLVVAFIRDRKDRKIS
jgi:hypothetical protein